MTTPMDSIYASAAAAAETVAQSPVAQAQSTTVAVAAPQANTAVAVAAPKLTMEQLANGSVAVDRWLKVNAAGLFNFTNKGASCEEIKVKIDMTEGIGFRPCQSVRWGSPNAEYAKSYDGVNTSNGGLWAATVEKARMVEESAKRQFKGAYPSVEIAMTLIEDAKDLKGAVLEKAGVTMGVGTSVTNWKNWLRFYNEVSQRGLLGKEVEVKIGFQIGEKQGVQPWGLYTFTLVGEYFDAADE